MRKQAQSFINGFVLSLSVSGILISVAGAQAIQTVTDLNSVPMASSAAAQSLNSSDAPSANQVIGQAAPLMGLNYEIAASDSCIKQAVSEYHAYIGQIDPVHDDFSGSVANAIVLLNTGGHYGASHPSLRFCCAQDLSNPDPSDARFQACTEAQQAFGALAGLQSHKAALAWVSANSSEIQSELNVQRKIRGGR